MSLNDVKTDGIRVRIDHRSLVYFLAIMWRRYVNSVRMRQVTVVAIQNDQQTEHLIRQAVVHHRDTTGNRIAVVHQRQAVVQITTIIMRMHHQIIHHQSYRLVLVVLL